MYGEHFDIPAPDELVLVSWFQGGEVFRSGCCYQRGRGRIFYFRPGHETYPTYSPAARPASHRQRGAMGGRPGRRGAHVRPPRAAGSAVLTEP